MPGIRQIKQRQIAIKRIRKITYAMQVIAETRLARIKKKAVTAKIYHNKIRQILSDIITRSSEIYHPLMDIRKEVKTIAVILINSDEGLCAGFNNNVFGEIRKFMLKEKGRNFKFIALGRKADKFLRGVEKKSVLKKISGINDERRYGACREIAEDVIKLYSRGEIDELYLGYNEYKLNALNNAAMLKVLPVEPVPRHITEENLSDYIYEPSAQQVLSALLPEYVMELIFYAALESRASEELVRMLAMKMATDNADQMIRKLTFSYHRARQEMITNEIAEIINAAQPVTG